MHTELKEYSRRRGTEYPYNDNLDVDVLIVGAGFGIIFPPSNEAVETNTWQAVCSA
jgi:hypothetical protein